jgi:ethanolamine utilization protein EutN
MILGRVTGNVVGTVKHPSFHAQALMIVQPINEMNDPEGDKLLAVDHAQAGPGDRVLVLTEGGGIRQVLGDPKSPIRALIVAVVDHVEVG